MKLLNEKIEIVYDQLSKILKLDNIKKNENMSNHTTLSVGGKASILIEPETEEEIVKSVKIIKENDVPLYVVGRGSNLLVSDEGLNGVVLKLSDKFSSVSICDNSIIAKSGTPIAALAKLAMKNSLSGLEFASGIPGTVGGAIAMNAGAYGGEMKDIVEWVKIIKENGAIEIMSNEDMQFSYRRSILTNNPNWIVVSVKINLKKGKQIDIFNEMQTRNEKRVSAQPLSQCNCGSTFKRPEGHFAGKLIEDCGLKGFSYNGVEISSKHAGFIVNNGKSTASDMLHVINIAKEAVKNKFGIQLEEEVKILK